jgi:predicted nucleic acid-binding protein
MQEICQFEWDPAWQRKFDHFLDTHALLTTSQVLVEVLHARKYSLLKRYGEEFRQVALKELIDITEHPVQLQDLRKTRFEKIVLIHGLTDATVLWLADCRAGLLVTNDEKLYSALPSDPEFEIRLTRNCV